MELSPRPVPADRTALVVIDLQNAFCHPNGSYGQVGADVSMCAAAVGPCLTLIDAAHQAGVPVFYTLAIHERDMSDWNLLAEMEGEAVEALREIGCCVEGTWDAAFIDEVEIAPEDVVLKKSRYSPFYETDLAQRLEAAGATDLVVCGVATSVCVESTVRDAGQRSYIVHIPEDAVGDVAPAAHEPSLEAMSAYFGWRTTADAIAAQWTAS